MLSKEGIQSNSPATQLHNLMYRVTNLQISMIPKDVIQHLIRKIVYLVSLLLRGLTFCTQRKALMENSVCQEAR